LCRGWAWTIILTDIFEGGPTPFSSTYYPPNLPTFRQTQFERCVFLIQKPMIRTHKTLCQQSISMVRSIVKAFKRLVLTSLLADDQNYWADFPFGKLPVEVFVGLLKYTPLSLKKAHRKELGVYHYPVALTHVCHSWREVVLGTPSFWTNILIQHNTAGEKAAVRAYLERSKMCPLSLTWFSYGEPDANAQGLIDNLIVPLAERWQRITLIADDGEAVDRLLAAMATLDFPILLDYGTDSKNAMGLAPFGFICRNAPLLRRCQLTETRSFPPIPSNLVVLDYLFTGWGEPRICLSPFFKFLSHVAHSLEHLRVGFIGSLDLESDTPRRPRIPLPNLKSLVAGDSQIVVDRILAPNLTNLIVTHHSEDEDPQKVAGMFDGFSAPKLQSLQFYRTPLLPLLTSHHLPSMFPQLESVSIIDCFDEPAFIFLLELQKPLSLQEPDESKPPQKHYPFPELKKLTMSTPVTKHPISPEAVISLKATIQCADLDTPSFIQHLTQLLRQRGIELILSKSQKWPISGVPPEFQDEFLDECLYRFELFQPDF
jgi:hypothetical protein